MHALLWPPRRGRVILAVVMLAVGVSVGLGAMVAAQTSDTVYYACVNNTKGTIKMVSETTTCASNETKLAWNQQGPQGLQGVPGEQGPQGVPGQPGDPAPPMSVFLADETVEFPIGGGGFMARHGVRLAVEDILYVAPTYSGSQLVQVSVFLNNGQSPTELRLSAVDGQRLLDLLAQYEVGR